MSRQDIIDYYDDCHGDYQRIWHTQDNLAMHYGYSDAQHRSHSDSMQNTNCVLAERLAVEPGDRVLDAGCGVGGTSLWLAEHKGTSVAGLNIQPMHVALARAKAEERGLGERLRFELGDFTDMPFPDDSFDAVLALESVCHTEDKGAFIREAARVLKPSGRLVVADYFLTGRPLSRKRQRQLDEFLVGWALPNLASVEDFGKSLEAAGFASIETENAWERVRRSSRRMYWAALLTAPYTGYRERRGIRCPNEARNRRAAIQQYRLLWGGIDAYMIFSAVKTA